MTWKEMFVLPRRVKHTNNLKDGNLILLYKNNDIYVGVVDICKSEGTSFYAYWDTGSPRLQDIENTKIHIGLDTHGNINIEDGAVCFVMEDFHDKNDEEFILDIKELNLKRYEVR